MWKSTTQTLIFIKLSNKNGFSPKKNAQFETVHFRSETMACEILLDNFSKMQVCGLLFHMLWVSDLNWTVFCFKLSIIFV